LLLLLLACRTPAPDKLDDTGAVTDSVAPEDSAPDSTDDTGDSAETDTQDSAEDPIDPHCVGNVVVWNDVTGETFTSLQTAVDTVLSRETLWLCPGGLVEPITVTTYLLNLRGYGADLSALEGGDRPMITIGAGSTLILRDLAMRSGGTSAEPGGAIVSDGANVSIEGVVFEENMGSEGGAIAIRGGELYAQDCTFARNTAEVGGAIAGEDALVTLVDVTVDANEAPLGAAFALSGSTFTMTHGGVTRNEAGAASGALAIDEATVVTVTTSDWGEGASDNTPRDFDDATSFGADASFTCAAGTCE
jgi:predicted outer membrane repeat protein